MIPPPCVSHTTGTYFTAQSNSDLRQLARGILLPKNTSRLAGVPGPLAGDDVRKIRRPSASPILPGRRLSSFFVSAPGATRGNLGRARRYPDPFARSQGV